MKPRSPWLWVPTLYFAEGLPYFIVNTISVVILKDLGMDNARLALLTSLIGLPVSGFLFSAICLVCLLFLSMLHNYSAYTL